MTVRQLVEVPALRTSVVAGSSGLESEILWAHSCELPRPWEWMGPGDLLMTTGHNVPPNATDQMAFLASLAGAGISGLVLAAGMDCPPLQQQASQLAEELAFPVLETAYEVPFVALSRVVAASGQGESQARLNRVLRVYDVYRTAVQNGLSSQQLLANLGVELGHVVHVVDLTTGRTVLDAGGSLPAAALCAIREQTSTAAALPGITRLKTGEGEFLLLPIGTHPGWVLVADVSGVSFDVLVLQHVNTIVTIEAERLRAAQETRLASSDRLLAYLIEQDVDPELVTDRLADVDLVPGPWQVLTASSGHPESPSDVQTAFEESGIPHLVGLHGDGLVVLTRQDPAAVQALVTVLGASGRIGVSGVVSRISRVADAVRQADWAREGCQVDARQVGRYGQDRPLFLPSTVPEAESLVRTVLGPLLDYDERHGTDLVDSLRVFFEANRSWQIASKHLQVHKQTLVYRMRRVAEVTGRRMDNLDDVAELHLALRANRLLHPS